MPSSPRPRLPGLRRARELAALTQAELAERAGIHRVSLANLERGAVGALPKTVRALAQVLECSPASLMSEPPAGGVGTAT
jgi:transcriptional regulator with XRE-family HTH domain